MIYGGTAGRVLSALERHQLKREGDHEWRCNSPFRLGSNSHGFAVHIDDDEHGTFLDHVSQESGSLYDLAKRLNVEISQRQQVAETKRRYSGIDDYAAAHGVTADDLRAAGWDECQHDARPALCFKTRGGLRYRYLDGERPSYRSVKGFTDSWYGFLHGLDMAKDRGVLVYANGPISVIAAQKHNIPAVTLAGSGERRIPEALLTELREKWPGEVWIALDCDDAGRRAAALVAEQIPGSKIIDLHLTTTGDLADLCLLHKEQAWARLSELAKTPVKVPAHLPTSGAGLDAMASALRDIARARREQAQNLPDLIEQAKTQIRELERERPRAISLRIIDIVGRNEDALTAAKAAPCKVRGLRSGIVDLDEALGGFNGGWLHVLYAATGMGKTTFTAQLAAAWSEQGRGLVVPTESNPYSFVNKMAASMTSVNTTKMDTGYIAETEFRSVIEAYDMLAGRGVDFLAAGRTTPDMIRDEIGRAIDEGRPYRWIAVDSLSNLYVPGADSLYGATSEASAELQAIALETGVMMWATSQVGRNMKDRAVKLPQINDAKGSGDVEEDADVILALYRHDYYVKRGELAPSTEFPPGTALLRILKHRHRDIDDGARSMQLAALAGVRFGDVVRGNVA